MPQNGLNARPAKRVASAAKKGGRNSQCVINHGMTPANIAGATTKNSAEPRIAVIFDMCPLMLSKRRMGKAAPGFRLVHLLGVRLAHPTPTVNARNVS